MHDTRITPASHMDDMVSTISSSSSLSRNRITIDNVTVDKVNNVTYRTANDTVLYPSSDCLMLQPKSDFLPWDNPDNLVSAETEAFVRRLRDVVILPILFLIGGPANVINMAVFYKQGLKERINVCLFALSLADELYLVYNMILYGEQLRLQFTIHEK